MNTYIQKKSLLLIMEQENYILNPLEHHKDSQYFSNFMSW